MNITQAEPNPPVIPQGETIELVLGYDIQSPTSPGIFTYLISTPSPLDPIGKMRFHSSDSQRVTK